MLIDFFKEILAPKKCYSCKKEWNFLCENCQKKLKNFSSICYLCKKKSNNFEIHKSCKKNILEKENIFFELDNIIIFSHYKNFVIKKMIEDFKFYSKKDIAEDFAKILSEKFIENFRGGFKDYIIIYPSMHFFKRITRWYNPAKILAKKISENLKIKLEKNIFKKIKNTKAQKFLSRQERLSNLEKSLVINKKQVDKIVDENIIIVDDIISTWATLNEMAKILKKNWAKKVIWLVIASD